MDYSSLLSQAAPTTVQQAQGQLLQQQAAQQQQAIQQAFAPAQLQAMNAANQAAQQDLADRRRSLGISMLTPVLNEPDPSRQQALIQKLVPVFNRYVPDMELDPDATDVSTIRALAQSQISPADQAKMQMSLMGQMGGFGGMPNGIFPNMRPSLGAIMSDGPAAAPSSAAPPALPAAGTQQTPAASPDATPAAQPPRPQGVATAYLQQVKAMNPLVGSMAEEMINGTFKAESGKGQNDPVYVAALQVAKRADPTFTAQALDGRPKMIANSTSGDMYKLEQTLNTGMAHLYDLYTLAPGNGNDDDAPALANTVRRYVYNNALGLPGTDALRRYQGTLDTAAPELAKYLGGGAAGVTSTAEAKAPFDEDYPSATIQRNAGDMGGKMIAKADSLQREYDQAMGAAANHQVATPLTRAMAKDMQGLPLNDQEKSLVRGYLASNNLPTKSWPNAAQQAEGLLKPPSGMPIVSSPSDPAFQQLPSGARFVTSDGQVRVKH